MISKSKRLVSVSILGTVNFFATTLGLLALGFGTAVQRYVTRAIGLDEDCIK